MINLITLFDLIYIAGFLDGDGAIIAQFVTRDDYKWKYQIRLSIQFTQHTKRSIYLTKLKDIIGAGSVRHLSNYPHNHLGGYVDTASPVARLVGGYDPATGGVRTKGINLNGELPNDSSVLNGTSKVNGNEGVSDYVITASESVLALLKQLQPYLRLKQKQADLAITLLEQLPLAKNDKVKFIELVAIVDQIASLNDRALGGLGPPSGGRLGLTPQPYSKVSKRNEVCLRHTGGKGVGLKAHTHTLTGAVVKEVLKNIK